MNRYFIHGPVYGKIIDNADPDQLGRVKVLIDNLGEEIETNWIPLLTPIQGIFILPEIDEQVIVSFIGDAPEKGVVLGSVWNNDMLPPEGGENPGSDLNKDGKNNIRLIRTRSGHKVIFDDKQGEERVHIITKDGKMRYDFLTKEKCIKITTDMDLTVSAKGKLIIQAEEVEIKTEKGLLDKGENISIESSNKDINIKSGKGVTVKGSGINLN